MIVCELNHNIIKSYIQKLQSSRNLTVAVGLQLSAEASYIIYFMFFISKVIFATSIKSAALT